MTLCLWCSQPEPCKHYHPSKDVEFICSRCTQLLCRCTQEKLRELLNQCEAKGYDSKVEALKSFIGELEYVPETRKVRSGMVRKRPVRPLRPARYEIRA